MGHQVNRPASAFSLDLAKVPRVVDQQHLAFIRTLPCLVCGTSYRVEAAHIRYGDPAHHKPKTALGRKPGDNYVVPLCALDHREGPNAQHRANERVWWEGKGIDPIGVAEAIYALSGDRDGAVRIISAAWSRSRTPRK